MKKGASFSPGNQPDLLRFGISTNMQKTPIKISIDGIEVSYDSESPASSLRITSQNAAPCAIKEVLDSVNRLRWASNVAMWHIHSDRNVVHSIEPVGLDKDGDILLKLIRNSQELTTIPAKALAQSTLGNQPHAQALLFLKECAKGIIDAQSEDDLRSRIYSAHEQTLAAVAESTQSQ